MTGPVNILRRLEQAGPSDRELIARFIGERDQSAFAELVRRHGPFVLGVCRRVAGHVQDAEDAFQAVFLVLACKARRLGNPDLLANWLHGVAVRVALKARRSAARRRAREVAVSLLPDPPVKAPPVLSDLGPVLDEELAALPSWYREAILLCDLRGLSREEAARLLRVPEGTLSSRLANGRTKLAARLMKRGVSLSVAVMPMLIGQAEAGFALSNELMAKTCALVANWSAGGLVPEPFANLAGGLTMRKTLMLGAVVLMAVAGAVVAAGSGDDPKPVEHAKRAVAAKGGPVAQQRDDTKPGEKPAFTSRPKLRIARDYELAVAYALFWSPDGEMLAFQGSEKATGGSNFLQLDGSPFNPTFERPRVPLGDGAQFVGFTPDGQELVIAKREYQLVSGLHKIQYIGLKRAQDGSFTTKPSRTVDLDADNTNGYSFVAEGKSYRTLDTTTAMPGIVSRIRVTSVDATTGKTLKTLLTVEGRAIGHALSPHGVRLAVLTQKGDLTVYDVSSGKSIWSKSGKFSQAENSGVAPVLEFSGNAARLLVSTYQQPSLVFNAESGDLLPALENVEVMAAYQSCLSNDGRLLLMSGDHYRRVKAGGINHLGRYMSVWDTNTGKLLKRWSSHMPSAASFHPARPILAILEGNENKTRLGLWDFSAEVEKK